MNIEDLTIGQSRELQKLFSSPTATPLPSDQPYEIGKHYLIRTVTMIDIGTVVRVTPQEIIIKDAAWVADTGRFSEALEKAEYNEVEPFPDGEVIIGRSTVIDAVQIKKLNRSRK